MMREFAIDPSALRKAWIAMGVALLLGIWIASLVPVPQVPNVPGGDKVHHFAAYALCAFWWCQLLHSWRSKIICFTVLACMGVLLEYLQGWSGLRHFDRADMLANAMGALAGGVLAASLPVPALWVRRTE